MRSRGPVSSKEVFRDLTTKREFQETDVETHARKAFSFLEATTSAASTLEREPDRSLLSYLLGNVFVEIELDWREMAVFVLLGETVEGKRPSGYYVDNVGRRVRWHIGAALTEGNYHENARNLRTVVKESGFQAMFNQIDAYSVGLRTVLSELPRLIQQLRSS